MRKKIIEAAQGKTMPDRILKNARVFNVFTGELVPGDIAIAEGRIAGVGSYDRAEAVDDLGGRIVVPGFINTHCHVESSMVAPASYCREELRWGVTTLVTDPHEVANVAGAEGVKFMLECGRAAPVNYYVQLPSCVPATPFENAGAVLSADDLRALLDEPGVLGLGEMMDYPGVLGCDAAVLAKLELAGDRVVDGHAPGLTGRDLQAYAAAGIHTDHESTTFEEALEKLRAGMAVLVREGSASQNLEAIVRGLVENGIDSENLAFCSDDKHIADIRREGTIRHCVRRAIALGMAPAAAYRMATRNAARIFGLRDLGAIAPGFRADLLVLDDWLTADIAKIYKDGSPIDPDQAARPDSVARYEANSVHIAPVASFALPEYPGETVPVIGILPRQIMTRKILLDKAEAASRLARGELCKLAVIERHRATGNVGVGLLAGYGLRDAAVASTVGHDSHNLIVAGTNDADMLAAVREIERIGGGFVLVRGGKVAGAVRLPLFGLMSGEDPDLFVSNLERLITMVHEAGVPVDVDPFVTLSFLALPVLPEIRLTDMGLFDVTAFRFF